MIRRLPAVFLAVVLTGLVAVPAVAHPLGNLTSNTYAGVEVREDGVTVDHVLDLAEVPTVQARREIDADGDGEISDGESSAWVDGRCASIADDVDVRVDGATVALVVEEAVSLTFPEGQAGLVTLRLECRLGAALDLGPGDVVEITDDHVADRIGWREITASGPFLAEADVPTESASDRLATYPEGAAPLDVREARLVAGSGDGSGLIGLTPTGGIAAVERVGEGLTDLMAREDPSLAFLALALLLSVVLGATHALAPGHGKTVMAAYLVSRDGTLRQMAGLGATVALTHTLGVLVLGLLVTSTQALAPERLYPWLGVLSGVLFAAIGIWLLIRARQPHVHQHLHGPDDRHGHDHGGVHHHDHAHTPEGAQVESGHDPTTGLTGDVTTVATLSDAPTSDEGAEEPAALGWRSLVLPGLAGGMLPSPSALVVLVAGIALGRLGTGLLLVLGYGVGMALTLVAAGWLLVRLRHRLVGRVAASSRWGRIAGVLPTVTAGLVVAGGLLIAGRSLLTL